MRSALRSSWHVLSRPWVTVLVIFIVLAAVGIFSPTPAWADDDLNPNGIGGLLFVQPLQGTNAPTLYEDYVPAAYFFDTNLGTGDVYQKTFNGLANLFLFLLVALVRGAIVIVWTMFSFSNTQDMTGAISDALGAASSSLSTWLLPTALATGALVAFAQQRRASGSGISQIAWVLLSGLAAVSMATSPAAWVNTVDQVRTLGSEAVMGATSDAIVATETPFNYPEATYDGSPSETMLRKSADSIWRSYVVTPWCIGEFGSPAACSKYGGYLLANAGPSGADNEAREDWLWKNVKEENGESSPVYRWTAGHSPIDRAGIALMALIVGAIFAIMILFLAFTALFAFVCALMLLFVGVFFVMLMCIPGKPRRWGLGWLDTLVGLTLQSVIATMILSAVLVLTSAALQLTASLGWAAAAGMSILVAVAGFTLRRTISTIMGALSPGGGMAAAMGFLALRGASRLSKGVRAVGKRGKISDQAAGTDRSSERQGAGGAPAGGGQRVLGAGSQWGENYRRSYRTVPTAGRRSTGPAATANPAKSLRPAAKTEGDNKTAGDDRTTLAKDPNPSQPQQTRQSLRGGATAQGTTGRSGTTSRPVHTSVARPARPVSNRAVGAARLRNDVPHRPTGRPSSPQARTSRPAAREVTRYAQSRTAPAAAVTQRPATVQRPAVSPPRPATPQRPPVAPQRAATVQGAPRTPAPRPGRQDPPTSLGRRRNRD